MTDKSMRFSRANEIAKLDKFNGTHSRRWKGKMYFLVALKLAHVLNEEKLEEEEEETDADMKVRQKWEQEDF